MVKWGLEHWGPLIPPYVLFFSSCPNDNRGASGPGSDQLGKQISPHKPFPLQTDPSPHWRLLSTKPPHLLDSWLAHSYLPIWNGVQDSGRRVCDSGSWEIVINLVWKHGDFILTIHSVVAEFGYPLIKDFLWLDLNYIKKRETRASLIEKSNSLSNQDTLSLQGGTRRKIKIRVYWRSLNLCGLWEQVWGGNGE